MIDTIHIACNLKFAKLDDLLSIQNFLKTLNPHYEIEKSRYVCAKDCYGKGKSGRKFRYSVRVKPRFIEGTHRSFYLKFLPLKGFRNLTEVKIETEVSHFSSLDDFIHTFSDLFSGTTWGEVKRFHSITRGDLIFNFESFGFNNLLETWDFANPRNPRVCTNLGNRRRTLYVSNNSYLYEKGEFWVREEHRLHGRKAVVKFLGVKDIFSLRNVTFETFRKKFSGKKFYDVRGLLKRELRKEEPQILSSFFAMLGDRSIVSIGKSEKKNKPDWEVSHNAFICAKGKCNKKYKKGFSRKIIPLFHELSFEYYSLLKTEFDAYFLGEKDYMIEKRTDSSVATDLNLKEWVKARRGKELVIRTRAKGI